MLHDIVHAGAVVKRGEKQQAVKTFKDALDWLLAQARDTTRSSATRASAR